MLSFKQFLTEDQITEGSTRGLASFNKRFKELFNNNVPFIIVGIRKSSKIATDPAGKQIIWTTDNDIDASAQLLGSNFPGGEFPTTAKNPWVEIKFPEKPNRFSDDSWKKNKSYWIKFDDIQKPGEVAGKSKVPVKPQHIFPKNVGGLKIDQIMEILKQKYGEYSELYKMAVDTYKNGYPNNSNGYDISSLGPKAGEAIRDYFTEVLHPISIILGKGYTGNANEGIEKIIIKEKLVNSDNIQYSMKTNEPIVDSSIIHKNRSVNISSKGGKGGRGAKAGASNLWKLYEGYADKNELLARAKDADFTEALDVLKIINDKGMYQSVIELCKKFKLIKKQEYETIIKLSKEKKEKLLEDNFRLPEEISPKSDFATSEEKAAYKSGLSKPWFWLMTILARRATKYINADKKLNFSDLCCLLINGKTIQMYSYAKITEGNIKFEKPFNTIWPDDSAAAVYLDHGKYTTTDITAGLSFVIKLK